MANLHKAESMSDEENQRISLSTVEEKMVAFIHSLYKTYSESEVGDGLIKVVAKIYSLLSERGRGAVLAKLKDEAVLAKLKDELALQEVVKRGKKHASTSD